MADGSSLDKGSRVVVVGAGIVGASIAFHLSERHVEVVVVEGRQPCGGTSGLSFGWLNAFGKEPASYHEFNRRSMDIWDRFVRRLGADVGMHWGGALRWVSTEEEADELRLRVGLLQERGYRTRTVDEDELRRLEPGLAPGPFVAAAFNENDGHTDPQKVVDSCLSQARRRGAVVHAKTPVTGLKTSPGVGAVRRLESVSTADGEIVCDAVVLAAGVATTKLAGLTGVDLPQEESPGVVVRTDPRPPVLRTVATLHTPSIDEGRLELHLRQNADGTLLIGESLAESLGRDDSQRHADDLLGRAVHYLPDLAGARAIPVPVGYRPMPVDGLPVLGFTEAVPNLYVALMHSGITLAPLVGEMAASEIVDGARVGLLEPYRPERFA